MKQKFIFGGYTKRINQGIHEAILDSETGKLENSRLIFKLDNPTYVCTDKSHSTLFALIQDGNQAGVIALQEKDQRWQEIDRCLAGQINACHISYYEPCQTLYLANYHQGCIDVYHFEQEQLSHLQKVAVKEFHPDLSAPVQMHFTWANPSQKLLYACNLGQDLIELFDIKEDGQLVYRESFSLAEGVGPRHFIHHPTLPIIYVIGEYDNYIHRMTIDEYDQLVEQDAVAALDQDQLREASGAAIKMTRDGKFLYCSTRFANFISVFAVDEQGRLERIQSIDTVGQIPRDFALDENEEYLLVPHQDSDFVSVFRRNPQDGRLKFANNDTEIPESVCIIPF